MQVEQTANFRRTIKKLKKNEKQALDEAVKMIMEEHEIGDMKIGDLAGVRVYKYKVLSSQYLLAYVYKELSKKITLLELVRIRIFIET